MTSFAHAHYPSGQPGALRAERLNEATCGLDGGRTSASLPLAAIVAALVMVAGPMLGTWPEHYLLAWIVMWSVGFVGLAATSARKATAEMMMYQGMP